MSAFSIISFLDGPVRYFLVVGLGNNAIVKDTQAENAHPKEIQREDKGFQIVKVTYSR